LTDCSSNLDTNDHCNGGMGIPLIKSLTDKQKYIRIDKRNVFTVTKHYTNQN
jgi:anti-sigma regulatory factor (Ser/Thr protein kinase)